MNILFLTQIVPYPPDAGPKVKTWHVLRYLAGLGHKVILASFIRPEEEDSLDPLRDICQAVYTVPIRRSRFKDIGYWLRSNLSGRPFLIERDDIREMEQLVQGILREEFIDIIHADQLTMTQFALPYAPMTNGGEIPHNHENVTSTQKGPILVFDAHNAVWTILERMRENAPWILKPVAGSEARRIKKYEGMVVSRFQHTLAVAEPDRVALEQAVSFYDHQSIGGGSPISVVPIAVDTQMLQPVSRKPSSKNILTLGTLHYPPNADGIRWFANEVFPLINKQLPETSLTIVGKNPPADFLRMASQYPGTIEVTGYVPDLRPYFEKAALTVIAVRAGGGMRVRILEAFALGMPVVTTTVGLEGIDAKPGEHILVEDDPQEFAKATIRLINDEVLQKKLSESGRKLAKSQYDWQVVLGKMDPIYGRIENEKLPRRLEHV